MHNVLIANKENLFAVVIKIATGESLTCCLLSRVLSRIVFSHDRTLQRQTQLSSPILIENLNWKILTKKKKPLHRANPPAPRKQTPYQLDIDINNNNKWVMIKMLLTPLSQFWDECLSSFYAQKWLWAWCAFVANLFFWQWLLKERK